MRVLFVRNLIQFYRTNPGGAKSEVPSTELLDHFIQTRSRRVLRKDTSTTQKMCAAGTGRVYFHHGLWRGTSDAKVVKRMLQCLTETFPTQSRLALMKKVSSPKCRSCTMDKEDNLFHWLQECPKFHDARTKVHHNIWAEVYEAIVSHLPKDWQAFKETPLRSMPTFS